MSWTTTKVKVPMLSNLTTDLWDDSADITMASPSTATLSFVTTSSATNTTVATNPYLTVHSSGGGTAYIDASLLSRMISQTSERIKISDGQRCKIELPDGTFIDVKTDGSFDIIDKDAKVIYRASRVRDFNPYLNVSDKLEEFIAFCGQQGVRRGEMLDLPVSLFIGWLVIQAAKADREPEPDIQIVPDLKKKALPRCPACGKFTAAAMRARRIEFCGPPCFEKHYFRYNPPLLALPAP